MSWLLSSIAFESKQKQKQKELISGQSFSFSNFSKLLKI